MKNISLKVKCAAKSSQNLQKSEFKKARENSNSLGRVFQENFSIKYWKSDTCLDFFTTFLGYFTINLANFTNSSAKFINRVK